jgi:hypothetical protein
LRLGKPYCRLADDDHDERGFSQIGSRARRIYQQTSAKAQNESDPPKQALNTNYANIA